MTEKITLEQLQEMAADPGTRPEDLAPYFRKREAASPFDPQIEIDETRVMVPDTAEAASRSALVLNSANWIERMKRQTRFHRRLSEGNYTGPIIVEEGDSWFQYPLLLRDVIDVLMDRYAIFSLSAGGDTLENMATGAQYRKALEETQASILLLSGGGNDLVADGQLADHLRPFDPNLRPADYLLGSFDQLIARSMALYDRIFTDVARRFPKVDVICHGYDYTLPRIRGKWLGQPMQARGIADPALQASIAVVMVDRLNAELARLARRHPRVHHLDLRGRVERDHWNDELHPDDSGYAAVAAVFAERIEALTRRPRGVPRGAGTGGPAPEAAPAAPALIQPRPMALSLHVGVNRVDQAHYRNFVQDLEFCVNDAEAMRDLAVQRGYETRLLTDAQATREALRGAMTDAAQQLEPGGIFLMSYAGHGAQIGDFNGDEGDGPDRDRLDETLCLHDAMLVDDELYQLWAAFREGVRVVAVFDSCHSGSILRASANRRTDRAGRTGRVRTISLGASVQIYRANRAFYDGLPSSILPSDSAVLTKELTFPVSASILQISACQSNQTAEEAFGNGLFTERLMATLAEGSGRLGYSGFTDRIAARMPPEQTPKFWRVGRPDPVFEAQSVFSV
ncbi:caspase family protein [Cereibacter sphaeroides]|uniref:caspase family protein n=1 Tax=Cereibacter sphaeroides TaxID=1063 RepID=UPI00136615E5|nr:caspase family protein [Cereibacter sphaeroides]